MHSAKCYVDAGKCTLCLLSVDCILRIKQKTQMLLVAKIGSYKIYDNSLLSLIDDNGWVPDEVCMHVYFM